MSIAIEPIKLYELVYQDVTIIDLRDAYLFRRSHILNSINIPFSQFDINHITTQKPIYLLCQTGQKAKIICEQLRQKGYTAYYINGGFQAFLSIPPHKYY